MNRLKKIRLDNNDTQDDIAKVAGVTSMTVSRWEKNESQIKPDKAQKISDHYGVSVPYLLGFSDFVDERESALRVFKDRDGFELAKSLTAEIIGERRLKIIENNYTKNHGGDPDFDDYIDLMLAITNVAHMEKEKELLVNFALLDNNDQNIILELAKTLSARVNYIEEKKSDQNLPF
ncbi:helix-turn-helix transcriptional regulator [Streptococcus pluranimalium]|uniref:helix-turn-helix transcriptional regulator n=1 Tax=Streptococcus pluranimalium TaxID=82348 RepID=UPI003F68FE55